MKMNDPLIRPYISLGIGGKIVGLLMRSRGNPWPQKLELLFRMILVSHAMAHFGQSCCGRIFLLWISKYVLGDGLEIGFSF